MTSVIFWGATGQARVLREAIAASGNLVALFDNRFVESPFADVPIFHGDEGLNSWERGYHGPRPVHACVAIGGARGRDRLELQNRLSARGYPPLTVIHARAFVAADASLGGGCQILAMAAVCANAQLGDASIVNTGASIDHDCIIGNGVHIAPGAILAGQVTVEDFAFVGTGAVLLPGIRIGSGAVVGAGAVVTRNVDANETVVGVPARRKAAH